MNAKAVMSMSGAMFLWSWVPLGVAVSGGSLGPFAFLMWITVAEMVVWFAYLAGFGRVIGRRKVWGFVVGRLRTRDGVLSVAATFWIIFFVWATYYIDTILVTVLTATSPILFVIFRQLQDKQRSTRRYRSVARWDWALLGIALAGISLVTLSQTGALIIEGSWWRIPVGLLSTAGALCVSAMAHRFKLGEDLYATGPIANPTELACLLVVMLVTSGVGLAIACLGHLVFGQQTAFSVEAWGVVAVGLVSGAGGVLFRHANLETVNLGINALQYLRPLLSMAWLGLFATVQVHRPGWLIIGTAAVIAANLLINFRHALFAGGVD